MKIFKILSIISKEERTKMLKELTPTLGNVKSNLLKELLKINENDYEIFKKRIFKKVYNKTYTIKSEDYLRNQISELHREVKKYIIKLWHDPQPNEKIYKVITYLTKIAHKFETEHFHKEWNYYYNKFKATEDYFSLYMLNFMMYNFKVAVPKTMDKGNQYLEDAIYYCELYHQDLLDSLSISVNTHKYMKIIYNVDIDWPEDKMSKLLEKTQNDPKLYQKHIIKLMEETDEEKKWVIANQCMEILKSDFDKMNIKVQKNFCKGLLNYATILSFQNQDERSIQIFEFLKKNNWEGYSVNNRMFTFYFNYSSILMKLGHYEDSIENLDRIMQFNDSVEPSKLILLDIRRIYLKLLNNELDQVFEQLNDISSKIYLDDQIMYIRVLYAYYFYKSGDIDSFLRECEITKKIKSYNVELTQRESQVINWMSKIATIKMNTPDRQKRDLAKLEKEIMSTDLYLNSNFLLIKIIENILEQENQETTGLAGSLE